VIRQHSVKHDYDMHHRLNLQPQFCRNNSFKKNVNNMGIKLHNNLPSYIKKSENIKFFNKKFKLFFLEHTFYSVEEYLSYEYLSWRV
jgi:hypothetical protein